MVAMSVENPRRGQAQLLFRRGYHPLVGLVCLANHIQICARGMVASYYLLGYYFRYDWY